MRRACNRHMDHRFVSWGAGRFTAVAGTWLNAAGQPRATKTAGAGRPPPAEPPTLRALTCRSSDGQYRLRPGCTDSASIEPRHDCEPGNVALGIGLRTATTTAHRQRGRTRLRRPAVLDARHRPGQFLTMHLQWNRRGQWSAAKRNPRGHRPPAASGSQVRNPPAAPARFEHGRSVPGQKQPVFGGPLMDSDTCHGVRAVCLGAPEEAGPCRGASGPASRLSSSSRRHGHVHGAQKPLANQLGQSTTPNTTQVWLRWESRFPRSPVTWFPQTGS